MVFQDGALFDSMTVFENVAFPLRERGEKNEAVIAQKVHDTLELVNMTGHDKKDARESERAACASASRWPAQSSRRRKSFLRRADRGARSDRVGQHQPAHRRMQRSSRRRPSS